MAADSQIAWCDDTVNTHVGCCEVRLTVPTIDGRTVRLPSECDNCYAKVWARRRYEGGHRGQDERHAVLWGNPKTTPRQETKGWRAAMRKCEKRAAEGGRRLCFSNSLSDLFEEHPMIRPWRTEFLERTQECPDVDFLLLTKRIQNVWRMVPESWGQNWPKNVWVGYSAGTGRALSLRARHAVALRAAGCPVVFISIEPQLESMDVSEAVSLGANWLITGGESGNGEDRPRVEADLDWFRRVRDVAGEEGVPYFHKQHGGSRPGGDATLDGRVHHEFPDTGLGPVGGVRAAGVLIRV